MSKQITLAAHADFGLGQEPVIAPTSIVREVFALSADPRSENGSGDAIEDARSCDPMADGSRSIVLREPVCCFCGRTEAEARRDAMISRCCPPGQASPPARASGSRSAAALDPIARADAIAAERWRRHDVEDADDHNDRNMKGDR